MVWIYRGKYGLGGLVTALFVALQIASNHLQMTYYFLFVMLFMAIAFGVSAWQKKELPKFVKSSAVLVIAGLVGICINLSNLYHTYQYSKESMRGKSELVKENSANQTSSGLERDYITQWSYGIGETFSLLVPNVKGGASVPLSQNEKGHGKGQSCLYGLYSQLGQYWGEQPGTAGPVYVGAFVMFLFILGCMIVKGPMKWALVAGTVFSIVLSWGKNFMGVTDFFIDYVPMYNKFRAVSSILVIAEFTIPLLAIMALKEIIDRPAVLKERAKAFYLSLGLTGGLSLLFALAPRFFFSSYVSSMEMGALQNAIPSEQLVPILMNLEDMRVAVFTSDAWRSFFIILIGVGLLWAFQAGKLTRNWLVGLLTCSAWLICGASTNGTCTTDSSCKRFGNETVSVALGNRQVHPGRQDPGFPRTEPRRKYVQRKRNLLLAQEHRRLSRCQTAPVSGNDRRTYPGRNGKSVQGTARCRRRYVEG